MHARARHSHQVSIHLDLESERFVAQDDRELPFTVRTIIYSGSGVAQVSGQAILKDGSEGAMQRYGRMLAINLPAPILEALIQELRSDECTLLADPLLQVGAE